MAKKLISTSVINVEHGNQMKRSMSNHELALCQWQVHKINIGEGYFIQQLL